jgi:hypothetical protein
MTPAHLAILRETAPFRGWGYGAWDPPRRRCDCSSFAASVLGYAPGSPGWKAINVWDHGLPWSGIQYLADQGALVAGALWPGPVQLPAGGVVLVQGWSGLVEGQFVLSTSTGHAFLWLVDGDPSMGWAVESQVGRGPIVNGTALETVIDERGEVASRPRAMAFGARIRRYDEIAWAQVG